MKILKTILVTIALIATAEAVVTSPMSNQFDNTGTIVKKDEIDIVVKNGDSDALSDGEVVIFDYSSADDGATVVSSASRGVPAACVVVGSIAAGAQGKCRIFGYHSGVNFSVDHSTATAGQELYVSGDYAGSADAIDYANTAGSGKLKAQHRPFALALDGASASGTVEAFINIR